MTWITRELQNSDAEGQASSEESAPGGGVDSTMEIRAQQCWHRLLQGFAQDIREFRNLNGTALLEQPSEFECRIANPGAEIAVRVSGEIPELMIRYDYQSQGRRAGVPEGAVLTIRDGGRSADLYSADERLTDEQARKLILEPVLFPNKSDALEQTGT